MLVSLGPGVFFVCVLELASGELGAKASFAAISTAHSAAFCSMFRFLTRC